MSASLSISHLDFEYESAPEALFDDLTLNLPTGWTGIVGANGTGKTTLLKLLAGILSPDRGQIKRTGNAILCQQDVFSAPENLDEFFASRNSYAFRLRNNLALQPEMADRWDTLSFGERKKLQIACALFSDPAILCIDEPTNHLDIAGRTLLLNELRSYRGTGVLVSHDRELLDTLCEHCLFLEHGHVILRSGGVSEGRKQAEIEQEQHFAHFTQLKKELKQNKQELQRRREKEQKARNKDCKRKLDRHDHDGKGRIDAARVSGRDRKQGDLAVAQAEIVARNEDRISELGMPKFQRFGLKIPYGAYAAKNILLEMDAQQLPLGEKRILETPVLSMGNRDRIAITGKNGSGKSTLLRRIVAELKLEQSEILYMPQELDEAMTAEIHRTLKELPSKDFSNVMNVVASLGSRPERVLDSETCSPGEWRKLFFGLGVLRRISLIIMDEPTNHLDLPSIECLEKALEATSSALLLISHDMFFLKNLCSIHWKIEEENDNLNVLRKGFMEVTI